jgi:hypothetical protein
VETMPSSAPRTAARSHPVPALRCRSSTGATIADKAPAMGALTAFIVPSSHRPFSGEHLR